MESAGHRHRRDPGAVMRYQNQAVDAGQQTRSESPTAFQRGSKERGDQVPKFTIDLTLPPQDRYAHVVPHFKERLAHSDLTGLFEDLVRAVVGGPLSQCVTWMAHLALRRVYDTEETAELRSIS